MSRKTPTGKQRGSAQKRVDWKALEIVHPDAAGIDVGGSEHWVAISPDCDPEPVRRFGCFTADVHEMGRWPAHSRPTVVASYGNDAVFVPERSHSKKLPADLDKGIPLP